MENGIRAFVYTGKLNWESLATVIPHWNPMSLSSSTPTERVRSRCAHKVRMGGD